MNISKYIFQFDRSKAISSLIPFVILLQPRSAFTWYNSVTIVSVFILLYLFVIFVNRPYVKLDNKLFALTFLISFSFFVGYKFQGSSLLALLCFLSLPLLSSEEKMNALSVLTRVLAIVVFISLFFWMIHFFCGFTLPVYRQLDLSIIGNVGFLDDYLFFVDNPTLIFPRFYSIYEEPGALGVLLSLVIIANQYNFRRKSVCILLLGLIFTYSLAGYIIITVCYMVAKIKSFRKFWIVFVGSVLLLLLLYLLFKDVEVFQLLIFNRIFGFDEYGLNHRTTADLNSFYSSYILSIQSLGGMGVGYSGRTFVGGSGYKLFLIDYGWIGLLSLFLIYLSISWNYRKCALPILTGVFLAFLPQGGAFITWQILLCGISCNQGSKK